MNHLYNFFPTLLFITQTENGKTSRVSDDQTNSVDVSRRFQSPDRCSLELHVSANIPVSLLFTMLPMPPKGCSCWDRCLTSRLTRGLVQYVGLLCFLPGTLRVSVCRRDSCPFGRRFCPLASAVCSRLLIVAAGPVGTEEHYKS